MTTLADLASLVFRLRRTHLDRDPYSWRPNDFAVLLTRRQWDEVLVEPTALTEKAREPGHRPAPCTVFAVPVWLVDEPLAELETPAAVTRSSLPVTARPALL